MAGSQRDKAESIAFLLPFFGFLLLMPPAVLVFSMPSSIAGVPIIILYIFAIWGGLIIGAAWLARRLSHSIGNQPVSSELPPLGEDQAG